MPDGPGWTDVAQAVAAIAAALASVAAAVAAALTGRASRDAARAATDSAGAAREANTVARENVAVQRKSNEILEEANRILTRTDDDERRRERAAGRAAALRMIEPLREAERIVRAQGAALIASRRAQDWMPHLDRAARDTVVPAGDGPALGLDVLEAVTAVREAIRVARAHCPEDPAVQGRQLVELADLLAVVLRSLESVGVPSVGGPAPRKPGEPDVGRIG